MPSPTTNRRSRPARCAFREDERQCRRNGEGNPPLCQAHALVVEQATASPLRDVVDRIRTGRRVSSEDLIGAVTELAFGMFGHGVPPVDPRIVAAQARRAAQARAAAAAMRARAAAQADPPPTPPPAKPDPNGTDPRVLSARRTMGFDNVYLHITVDEVKARRRELARKYHPDHAHDDRDRAFRTQQMAHINAAADLLLEGFG